MVSYFVAPESVQAVTRHNGSDAVDAGDGAIGGETALVDGRVHLAAGDLAVPRSLIESQITSSKN